MKKTFAIAIVTMAALALGACSKNKSTTTTPSNKTDAKAGSTGGATYGTPAPTGGDTSPTTSPTATPNPCGAGM